MPNRDLLPLALLSLFALPGAAQVAEVFPPDKTEVFKVVPGENLKLHIFFPDSWKAEDHRPAIVFFFGGGWVGGAPQQFYPHSRHFAERGMVAVAAEYRTKTSHGTDPFACIADGKSAVRWLRAHASELGIDPNRIAAGGGSAGGHVAASTATLLHLPNTGEDRNVSSVPNALLLFNPVIDTTMLGYGAAKLGTRAVEASPVHHVRAGIPPAMIFHGAADTTVPFENVERFRQFMEAHGNTCELIAYKDKAHGFFNYSRDKDIYQDTLRHADRFLDALGY
jgi:acetyl esterase/lipase